ncbi:mechanosensitive ion channel family protein [Thermodesulfobacteriota bacterium]
MEMINNLRDLEIIGNQLWRILALFGVILISMLLGKIVRFFLQKSAQRFESRDRLILSTTLSALGRGSVFLLAAFGISIGLTFLALKSKVAEVSTTLSSILLSIGIGYFLYWLVDIPGNWLAKMAKKTESKLDDMIVPVIRKSLRVTVFILVLVQIAQILSDKPITSIIAGLGIGGLAIALGAQDTIKNFFGSVVLFMDKPFEIGDRVVIDGHDGPVEEVGLRSTKIRTLDGHLVTVPNGELAGKTIQNIGKRPFIKRTVNITITYDTPPEKIDRALEIIKGILDNHEGMDEGRPPRVFFNNFNDASLNIMVIYWYHPPKYWDYMAFTEKFNREVFRRFNEEGIDFAFPTQTVYLAGDPSRPLSVGIRSEKIEG